jgi:inward rectifier potassium channel
MAKGNRNEQFDPGIGTRFKRSTKRIINKDGTFNVEKRGVTFGFNDTYLFFINLSWPAFLAWIFVGFIAMNSVFAMFYVMLGDQAISVSNEDPIDHFLHAFFFSTQTFTTVGYGAISPTTHGASLLASFEALIGFLCFSMATGLLFGRFSKPTTRIKFSEHALIQRVQGIRSIVFRMVNERPSQLMDMQATVILNMSHKSGDGVERLYQRLKLQVDRIEFFPLNWTIVHPIDEQSPFFDMDDDHILASQGELLIHVKGFDELFAQEVHRRFSYQTMDLIPNARFLPMFETDESGEIVLHLERLDAFEAGKS